MAAGSRQRHVPAPPIYTTRLLLWVLVTLVPIAVHADTCPECAAYRGAGQSCLQVVISEVVTDPQQDWNDPSMGSGRRSGGGDGVPFNATPGTGSTTSADEWVELRNVSNRVFDLAGWQLLMIDTTPATEVLGAGNAVLRFSHGGSLTHFQPGERLVIGNPRGATNPLLSPVEGNDVYSHLRDAADNLLDDVEIGDDFEEDGVDGVPFPGENGYWLRCTVRKRQPAMRG